MEMRGQFAKNTSDGVNVDYSRPSPSAFVDAVQTAPDVDLLWEHPMIDVYAKKEK